MKRSAVVAAVVGVAMAAVVFAQGGAKVLFDGTSLGAWEQVGDANWTIVDGAVQATEGKGGHLVSKEPFGDFELTAEFWVETAEDEQRHLHPLSGSANDQREDLLRDQHLGWPSRAGFRHRRHRERRQGHHAGENRRAVGHHRDHCPRTEDDCHRERRQDGGR